MTEPVVPDEEITAESFDPLMVMVTVAGVPSAALTVKVSSQRIAIAQRLNRRLPLAAV